MRESYLTAATHHPSGKYHAMRPREQSIQRKWNIKFTERNDLVNENRHTKKSMMIYQFMRQVQRYAILKQTRRKIELIRRVISNNEYFLIFYDGLLKITL